MNHPSEFAALFKLPLEERQRLADELLESIEAEPEAAAIPEEAFEDLPEACRWYEQRVLVVLILHTARNPQEITRRLGIH